MLPLMVLLFSVTLAIDIQDVVFVISSQNNKYNSRLSENLRHNIQDQSDFLYKKKPVVHISNKDFSHNAGWIFLPVIYDLVNLHRKNASWFFFMEDYTTINIEKLLQVFEKHNQSQDVWFGNALYDEVATIIHHFAFYEDPTLFKYPNLASGFAISLPLLIKLSSEWEEDKILTSNFHIDSAHELARFVWNEGKRPMLKHETALCSAFRKPPSTKRCASYPSKFHTCDKMVPRKNIYFAVKTCAKFHTDRVPVVKKTWGRHAQIIKFFSDKEDKSIPTINLKVPNVESGHCVKTMTIIRYIVDEIRNDENIKWVIIADDDTILGVTNLQRLLSCYDYTDQIGLGERYGFELLEPHGYNYITGGGGMVFSKPLLIALASSCVCPSLTTPDDMYIGICMARLRVEVTHAPGFHQARPSDYSGRYLESHESVSFHKHFMNDPVDIYREWFEVSDTSVADGKNNHNEL